MNNFRFDPEKHEYWLGESRLPSVTEILNDVGLISDYAKNEEAALRGTYVHKACALLIDGELDWNSVDERITGYVKSFHLWVIHCGLNRQHPIVEKPGFNSDFGYGGTPDLIFNAGIRSIAPLLVDLKSGTPAEWHRLQTAAYVNMNDLPIMDRATVYLNRDGKMPLYKEHTDPIDWQNFKACVRVYRLKRGMR